MANRRYIRKVQCNRAMGIPFMAWFFWLNMENSQETTLADLRWIPLDGEWEKEGADGLVFTGGEYDPPESEKNTIGTVNQLPPDRVMAKDRFRYPCRVAERLSPAGHNQI
jgi:hypothetical protein